MTEKLKPCPFCGGEAEMIFWKAMKDARVRCKACDVSTHDYRTPEEAIEAWNIGILRENRLMKRGILKIFMERPLLILKEKL